MNNNNDSVKQENKRAMPKFILIMAASLVVGGLLGVALVALDIERFAGALAAAGQFFTTKIAGWLLIALPFVELAVCLPIYFGAKKRLSGWDGEDEAVSSAVEARLSVCIWITGMALIVSLFLLSGMIAGFVGNVGTERDVGPAMFFGGMTAFLAGGLGVTAVLQQKLVDVTKRLNPEKRGSVYDVKFQKKWIESCDEAERLIIGKCAYRALQATGRTCLALWVVFAVGGMFFDWGFVPAMAVCIIWGVGQSVYSYSCIKLSKPGAEL